MRSMECNDQFSDVLSFDAKDFSHELQSAAKVKKTPRKSPLSSDNEETVPTLILGGFGSAKIRLDFGDSAQPEHSVCRVMKVENTQAKKLEVSFLPEGGRSSSELTVTPSTFCIAGKSQETVNVHFNPTSSTRSEFFGKISFKISNLRLPVEVKAVAKLAGGKTKRVSGDYIKRAFSGEDQSNNISVAVRGRNLRLGRPKRVVKVNTAQGPFKKATPSDEDISPAKIVASVEPEAPAKHKSSDEKLMKILHGTVGVPQKKTIPLTKPKKMAVPSQKEDKKLMKLLEGPTGIPFIKKKSLTKPVSFQLGKKPQMKVIDDIEAFEATKKSRAKPASSWKDEIKNLRGNPKGKGTAALAPGVSNRKTAAANDMRQKQKMVVKKKPVNAKVPTCNTQVRRILYDEHWAEKQVLGFTAWLNHTFYPAEDSMLADGDDELVSAPGGGARAKAKDHFSVLLKKRKQAKIRHLAFKMYHTGTMNEVNYMIDKEVAEEKLRVRTDRELYADLGLRSEIVGMMLSYNPIWLRLGLETTYGEVIPMGEKDIQDAGKKVLKSFVVERMLQDTAICEQFKTSKQGVFGKGYTTALARATLRRFLMVVLFLDKAKQANILSNGPCLFTAESKIKSSATMVTGFAKKFLSGEGDILRHLSLLGYTLTYKQTLLDEFDYKVDNLASDLRDGIRLCRLVELMVKDKSRSLSKQLRLPAGSLLQKKHNVKLALGKVMKAGVSMETKSIRGEKKRISVDTIVQAHKENTLTLLWRIMVNFQLNKMVPSDLLGIEINSIKGAMSDNDMLFVSLQEKEEMADGSSSNLSLQNMPLAQSLKHWTRAVCARYQIPIYDFTSSFADGRALCAIVNFYHPELLAIDAVATTTTSLGSANTSFADRANDDRWCMSGSTKVSGSNYTAKEYNAAIDGEKKNFRLFNDAILALGSIPTTLEGEFCSEYVPEEKSVVACVGYLCARLLESSKEIRAAIKVQAMWRVIQRRRQLLKHRGAGKIVLRCLQTNVLAKRRKRFLRSIVVIQSRFRCRVSIASLRKCRFAVVAIQKCCRIFLAKKVFSRLIEERIAKTNAALVFQSVYRMYCAKRFAKRKVFEVMQIRSATKIQSFIRMLSAARSTQALVKARKQYKCATVVQSFVRMTRDKNIYRKMKTSACTIQTRFRCHAASAAYVYKKKQAVCLQAFLRMVCHRESYLQARTSIVRIQSCFRVYMACQEKFMLEMFREQKLDNAAACIQSLVRMKNDRRKYTGQKRGVVTIQRFVRGAMTRNMFHVQMSKIVCVQAFARRCLVRAALKTKHAKATVIQSCFRRFSALNCYQTSVHKIVRLQSFARKVIARAVFYNVVSRISRIQSFVRGCLLRRYLNHQKLNATAIQSSYRRFSAQKQFQQLLHSVIRLQAMLRCSKQVRVYRLLLLQKMEKEMRDAVTCIQSLVRMKNDRRKYTGQKRGVVTIQRFVRGAMTRNMFHVQMSKIVCVQAFARRCLVRAALKTKHAKATVIQSCFRRFSALNCYQTSVHKIVRLQSFARMQWARMKLCALREEKMNLEMKAAVLVQSHVRSFLAKRTYFALRRACTVVQSVFRRFFASKRFRASLSSIVKMQSFARMWKCQHHFCLQKTSSNKMCSRVRQYLQRLRYISALASTVVVQAHVRRFAAVKRFRIALRGFKALQSVVRGGQTRRTIHATKLACRVIACWYLNILNLRHTRAKTNSAVRIQACFRGCIARKRCAMLKEYRQRQESDRLRMISAARKIQQMVRLRRLNVFARVLQRFALVVIAKHRAIFKVRCVVKLQSLCRAVAVRKKMPAIIKAARLRVEKAAREVEEANKLGNRTAAALEVLLHSKNLSCVKRAIVTLEVSTKHSHLCAIRFVEDGAVPIIYKLIRSCNRSEPHRALLTYALNVLRQVACFEVALIGTHPSREKRVDTLIELMQTFRDQANTLHLILHLMFQLVRDLNFAKELSKNQDAIKRMESILRLLRRKVASNAHGSKKGLEARCVHNLDRLVEKIKHCGTQ